LAHDTSFLAFLVAALVLLLIPGPGVMYIVARSVSQGSRAGLVSVLGLSVGALVHVTAATAGVSAIRVASATAFGTFHPRSSHRLFADGVLVSVFNPKLAVFFLAFLHSS
jgi:threonine/homoserine/homoserine lactone efflux protein